MMEIEKFKDLLFDEKQKSIFEHLPKPVMYSREIYKKRGMSN